MKPKLPRKRQAKTQTGPTPSAPFKPASSLPIHVYEDLTLEENAREAARQILAPEMAASRIMQATEADTQFGQNLDGAGMLAELRSIQKAVNAGDLSTAEGMLVAQAVSMQNLSAHLIQKALVQEWRHLFECFMKLGLRAQRQSCLTIEALGALKHGPAIMARLAQVNVAHGAQQVNNAASQPAIPAKPAAQPHTDGLTFAFPPNQVSAAHGSEELDTGTARGPGSSDPALAPLGEVNRPKD